MNTAKLGRLWSLGALLLLLTAALSLPALVGVLVFLETLVSLGWLVSYVQDRHDRRMIPSEYRGEL